MGTEVPDSINKNNINELDIGQKLSVFYIGNHGRMQMVKAFFTTDIRLGVFYFSVLLIAVTLSGCGSDKIGKSARNLDDVAQHDANDAIPIRVGTVGADVMDEIRIFQPLVKYLNTVPELKAYSFSAVAAADHESVKKLLQQKKMDIYIDSPFPIVTILEKANLKILLRRAKKGVREYHSVIFTLKDSGVSSIDGLEGHTIAFEDRSSTSSYAMPCASLIQDGRTMVAINRLGSSVPAGSIGYVFSEDDANTTLWVLKGKVFAGATNNVYFDEMPDAQREKMTIVYRTDSVARHIVSGRSDLGEEFISILSRSLMEMTETESGRRALKEFEGTSAFDILDDQEVMVRKVLQMIEILSKHETE